MILAVNYDPKKFPADYFPVAVTEKYDGVAGRFTYTSALNRVLSMSRQHEEIKSTGHIEHWLRDKLPPRAELIGELMVPGLAFKDGAGVVRREVTDERIVLFIYDYVLYDEENNILPLTYDQRMEKCIKTLGPHMTQPDRPVVFMPTLIVHNHEQIEDCKDRVFAHNPKAEGIVIRPLHHEDSLYRVGRSKALIRWKPEPTLDLRIHSFVEAVDKHKQPMGMVGRINVWYKGKVEGVGPGKMTHKERTELWQLHGATEFTDGIIEVKYMPDETYTGLRQGTFQRWRTDKKEPDA